MEVIAGDGISAAPFLSLDPSGSGQGWSGERTIDLSTLGLDGPRYFRAQCTTDRGDDVFRAYTNPIWYSFDATSVPGDGARLSLSLSRNPFAGEASVTFNLPHSSAATLSIYDTAGRLVRAFRTGSSSAAKRHVVWDGTDSSGNRVASGVYLFKLEHEGSVATTRGVLLR